MKPVLSPHQVDTFPIPQSSAKVSLCVCYVAIFVKFLATCDRVIPLSEFERKKLLVLSITSVALDLSVMWRVEVDLQYAYYRKQERSVAGVFGNMVD